MSGSDRATTRHWQRHIQRWRNGTLSKSDYCREHGLAASSFHRWVKRLAEQPSLATPATAPGASPLTLIPVQLREDASAVPAHVVARAGRLEISLPVSLDAAQARTWLDALAQVR